MKFFCAQKDKKNKIIASENLKTSPVSLSLGTCGVLFLLWNKIPFVKKKEKKRKNIAHTEMYNIFYKPEFCGKSNYVYTMGYYISPMDISQQTQAS